MRRTLSIFIPLLFLVLAAEVHGQDLDAGDKGELASAADVQPRTPIMVVREPAVLRQPEKPRTPAGPLNKRASLKKPGDKPASSSDAAQPGTATQHPIIIPAPGTHEMASTGNPAYDQLIAESATRNGIDPNLIIAVMRQESGFNARARSYKGATGLMQLMPATASRFGVVNIYDPKQNIEGGARYLRFLMDTFDGDVELVLAGYNAGENAVVNSGYRVPNYRETRNYVRSISARYNSTGSARKLVIKNPAAPAAATFATEASSRLSNNY
jgi:hypothetical protein